jgi:predicted nucleic acid-binding protein
MKLILILYIFLHLTNCSLSTDSDFWTKDLSNKKKDPIKMSNILKNTSYSTEMSLDEFKNYIDDYTKKSKYPNINQ